MMDKLYKIERKLLYKELQPLFEGLSIVRYAVIKGEVLSNQIYGVPDQRMSNDIDILIDKKNVKLLEEQLLNLGFEQQHPEDRLVARRNRVLCLVYSHQIPSYHKEKFGLHFNVDVNYDVFWGEYEGQRCSIEEFLSDTEDTEIYGVKVQMLSIEKALVQLVLHHYKEMNSIYHLNKHNCIRTDMFKDVYDMIFYNLDRLTVEKICWLSFRYQIVDIVYYMLYYTYYVFRDERLKNYLSELSCFANKDLMESYGLCSTERKRWFIPFEERLDNDNIWDCICNDMSDTDLQKVMLGKTIFT